MNERELPIKDYRRQILDLIDRQQVTILTAETGAGKSTQMPQYLIEHGYHKVVVTQPRILAARNLSARVREEWTQRYGQNHAEEIGYRTAYERDDTESTKILYCTDGLQVVREVTGNGVLERQILVLDEIHEWNQNMEVLVAWAKRRCQEDPLFKVVIMSATLDADRLATYFLAAEPITIPGRSFPVTKRQGTDVIEELLAATAKNILVFLPGKAEIEYVATKIFLETERKSKPVIPLHSQLSPEEQQKAFTEYPNGKIILATNIAQTSITISDIDLVIDSGLERRTEIHNGVEGLYIAQISQADCLQRAGRAGRTKAGEYVLAPFDQLACQPLSERPPYPLPEISRTHLDRLILRLFAVNIDIESLQFFHAPDPAAIRNAIHLLQTLGALTPEGELTEIGHRMGQFPVSSRYARMLVEADELPKVLRLQLCIIIAIQEVGGLVRNGLRSLGWLAYTNQTQSDLLAHYQLYLALPEIELEGYEELGILAKNVEKVREVASELSRSLDLNEVELSDLDQNTVVSLLRCIVAGQIDLLWVVIGDGKVQSLFSSLKRELSSGTVVTHPGLLAAMPFDLEVQTARGLETLHLVQAVTEVDPCWLLKLLPGSPKLVVGSALFDPKTASLARSCVLLYNGKRHSFTVPIRQTTKEHQLLFASLYARRLFSQLEEDRLRIRRETGKRMPQVPLQRLQIRVQQILGGAISLQNLSSDKRQALQELGKIHSYQQRVGRKFAGRRRTS